MSDDVTLVAELQALAVAAAQEAGRFLVDERPSSVEVAATKSSPTDVVTAMDTGSERLIVARIRASRPDDAFLGEEGTALEATPEAAAHSRVRWLVDPIDGTVNYLYDIPGWVVSIAAELDGVVVAGAVVNPKAGECFTATKGGGAWLNDEPIQVRDGADLSRSLIATGFGYDPVGRAAQAAVASYVIPRVADIRRLGAAAGDLCALACGRVDGYYERGLSPWDLVAGGLIAAEAGARVEGLNGAAAGGRLAVAAGPALFPQLHDLLVAAGS